MSLQNLTLLIKPVDHDGHLGGRMVSRWARRGLGTMRTPRARGARRL